MTGALVASANSKSFGIEFATLLVHMPPFVLNTMLSYAAVTDVLTRIALICVVTAIFAISCTSGESMNA